MLRERSTEAASHGGHPRRARGRHVLWGLLAVGIAITLTLIWSDWGKFDPAQGSLMRERAGVAVDAVRHPWYFPVIVCHIVVASIALVTGAVQLLPGVRRRAPAAHRWIGRTYVFAGVLPGVVTAVLLEAFWPFSAVTALGQYVIALLWAVATAGGWLLRRRGRVADHRRWMYRSYALTATVLVETLVLPVVELAIGGQLHSRLIGDIWLYDQIRNSTASWLTLVVIIVAAEGWFEYERVSRRV